MSGDGDEDIDGDEPLEPVVETTPNEVADPSQIVDQYIPADVRTKYEFLSYRGAAVALATSHSVEFADLLTALRNFSITTEMIRKPGGNESEIPKLFSKDLRPAGWHETIIRGDLLVKLTWRQQTDTTKAGKPIMTEYYRDIERKNFLDGHKIDYVKGKVAFDLEWNSKDQTFDRDLYAFNAFFQSGVINVGVLVTRGETLNPALKAMGPSLKKDGTDHPTNMTIQKYGASTTWWGKLIYRLNAGRNGGCPVLAVGITPKCINDWPPKETLGDKLARKLK
jgi:hypothetical protein